MLKNDCSRAYAEPKHIVLSHTPLCKNTIKSLSLISGQQLDSSVYHYCVLGAASLQQRTNISYREDYIDREVRLWLCVCACVCALTDRYFIWCGLLRKKLSSGTQLPAGCLLQTEEMSCTNLQRRRTLEDGGNMPTL